MIIQLTWGDDEKLKETTFLTVDEEEQQFPFKLLKSLLCCIGDKETTRKLLAGSIYFLLSSEGVTVIKKIGAEGIPEEIFIPIGGTAKNIFGFPLEAHIE